MGGMIVRALALGCLLLGLAGAGRAQEPSAPESDLVLELMSFVEDAAELVAEEGVAAACEQFREPGPWYQGDEYVFVFDLEGRTLCHPSRPELEGQSLLDLEDPLGKPIVRNMLREVAGEREQGWIHYLWPLPNKLTMFWKTSYVRLARTPEGDECIVGSGLYDIRMERFFIVEQVRDAVELLEMEGEAAFPTLRDPSSGFLFYDAYVFVMDDAGEMLVNVAYPELEGTSVSDLEDDEGKAFVREMLERMGREESAWVEYLLPRPGEERPARKASYLRKTEVEGRTLIVGAGVYSN